MDLSTSAAPNLRLEKPKTNPRVLASEPKRLLRVSLSGIIVTEKMKRVQKKVQELEQEKQFLQENEELKSQMASVLTSSDGGGKKVKECYLKKLTGLEDQVAELKRKLETQSQMSCQKPKRVDGVKAMQDEITSLKAQKVDQILYAQSRLCTNS